MQVIIFGPPGVGKGTQSFLIAEKLGLIHLSTGEILRNAVEHRTRLGLLAKETMESGKLVSDEVMIGIIKEALSDTVMKEKGFTVFSPSLQELFRRGDCRRRQRAGARHTKHGL